MKIVLAIALAFSFCIFGAPAHANFESGNSLYEQCTATKDDPVYYQKSAQCTGYILGVYDTIELVGVLQDKPKLCLGEEVVVKQLVDIVVADLRDNPKNRHLSAAILVEVALKLAFPCGTKSQ